MAAYAIAACAIIVGPRRTVPADLHGLGGWLPPRRAAASDGTARFFIIGDWGRPTAGLRVVAAAVGRVAKREGMTFGITLGDNFYPLGVTGTADPKWRDIYEANYGRHGLPVFASLGNHDWYREARPQWRYVGPSRTWQMPAPRYAFTIGPVRFIALDTMRWDTAQARWLADQLAHVRDRWVVVYGHHPVFSHGMHGGSSTLASTLEPLLRGRVDFYIAGHDHDKQVIERTTRPVYVVAGSAATSRAVRRGPNTRFAARTLGFAGMRFDQRSARLRFYDQNGRVEYERSYRVRPAAASTAPRSTKPTTRPSP